MGTFKRAEQEEMEHFEEHLSDGQDKTDGQNGSIKPIEPIEPINPIDSIESLTDRNAPWRDELRKSMKAKERTQIDRVIMPDPNLIRFIVPPLVRKR